MQHNESITLDEMFTEVEEASRIRYLAEYHAK